MTHSSTCHKIMGVVRIVLGLVMLVFGGMKLLNVAGMADLGLAAHKVGLTFLSAELWGWIATFAEIAAGVFLLTGHRYKVGALLTLIVMAFAINFMGLGWLPIAVVILSLAVLIRGAGAWRICHGKCCMPDIKGKDGCCGHGGCGHGCECKDGEDGCGHHH